ncbi:hypothetical protein RHGRI_011885 [Rhododendron griersonianum]|uniref:Neprosin PEP catalytic domain-containing protein n=1 Tax=Rhododendron griersonianum TaxID=479676 RepID=A0AAV6KPI4_9ERIC|nr:hypothetical protein RHGRI_011885 [Rhododendron griersonianum]
MQLKLLNKPAVKTIHTEYGDIIDCVDFYKQPAFDHPLLKNHTFHYGVGSLHTFDHPRDQDSSNFTKPVSIGLKGGGCPIGTVPIRRITKEDLIRERLSSRTMSSDDNTPGAHYAVARTRSGSNKFLGAGAQEISLHNPHASGSQYSAAKIKIQNGPDSIEVGWRVDPSLYGDSQTRLFIRLDAGQSHCFNTRCPGFIIVRSDIPLDWAFHRISQPFGDIFFITAYIVKDKVNGNRWLLFEEEHIAVGFWPKRIFTGLGDLANSVEWGGEVFSPPGTPKPPMGAGHFAIGSRRVDSFFGPIAVLNEYGQTVDPDNVEEFADNKKLYNVRNKGIEKDFGRVILYGGRGGSTGV